MSVRSATASGRRAAEARMLDVFDVKVATGGWVFDEATGTDVLEYALLFTTKGRVKATRSFGNLNQEVGGRTATTVTREWHIPVDSPAIPLDAVAFCVAVDESTDPSLLGSALRIAGPAPGSQSTARRLEVTEAIS